MGHTLMENRSVLIDRVPADTEAGGPMTAPA
jgi:hypothetical protein